MEITSNKELYDYLLGLAARLEEAGAAQAAEPVLAASRTAWGIPTTEFLGESRIALKRVLEMDVGLLTDNERSDLLDVVSQLNVAPDKGNPGTDGTFPTSRKSM